MHSNNEIGTIEPISEISKITKEKGILLHTDAAMSVGNIPVDAAGLGVDMLTILSSILKIGAGAGCLPAYRDVILAVAVLRWYGEGFCVDLFGRISL